MENYFTTVFHKLQNFLSPSPPRSLTYAPATVTLSFSYPSLISPLIYQMPPL